jgi:succinyldiaminopimelate transaminase
MPNVSARLPQFPWDRLKPYAAKADAHPGGRVDLSVGTPVDPTPQTVRRALTAAADSAGYPATHGTNRLREAASAWMARTLGVVVDPAAVLPLVGSKELVASLPAQLGLAAGDAVAHPTPAYPTYRIGAMLAGASPVALSDAELTERWIRRGAAPGNVRLIWLNSPANPHGRVLAAESLREIVAWARQRGVLVVSDECYVTLGWEDAPPVSVLCPEVSGGSPEGLLAVHSMSKRSNLAGYRAAFLAGDPQVVAELLAVRRHAGMMMPGPIQAAAAAALEDDEHAIAQKERYRSRRSVLRSALEAAGFRIDQSAAGLYLWVSRIVDGRPEPCWDTVRHLADLGILVAPGEFYGPGGEHHVRVALTATDERVAAAAARLDR